MGALVLPASGLVYVDANPVIYSVEKHPVYGPLLQPLWQAAQAKTIEVVSSDLVLMEVLVGPLKSGDTALIQNYEQALTGTDMRLLPITQAHPARRRRVAGENKTENAGRAPRRNGTAVRLRVVCHQRSRFSRRQESSAGDPR